MSTVRSPIEDALNLALFGPLGLVLAVKDALPDCIEKGRARVGEQFTIAKAVGEMATGYGQKLVTDKLVGLGVLPGPPPPRPEVDASANGRAPASRPRGAARTPPASPRGPIPDTDDLAIPGYDSLSASQVVSRLAGLARAELEAVQAYEAAGRGRRTVLTKISQLQTERNG